MHGLRWQLIAGVILIALSATIYFAHYALFGDAHHIFSYLITDLAFLPVEVLLVTMIIHQLLTRMETKTRLEKLNVVIGVFFSEMGTPLLTRFSDYDPNLDKIRGELVLSHGKSDSEIKKIGKRLVGFDYGVDIGNIDLEELKWYLAGKKDFLVQMLQNPTLLEHESFTDLLMAVFHLAEELSHRESFKELPASDLKHLQGDIKRAYGGLAVEWLSYMKHLQGNYPYLFSLALRTNPFDKNSSPLVGY
ncbi:MAG: hypothetical protein HYS21_10050 [Deltaproteobacteria bacterium]|nr:hypothetical protein [Deltaproteobacteria bacterium]